MASSATYAFVFLVLMVSAWTEWKSCDAIGTFGFDIHHVLSDQVREIMAADGPFPETNSVDYYRLLAHRDRWVRGRRLASNNNKSTLTFASGNQTFRFPALGFLHYANVSVGTPARWFLVALDTGSDLFWLPCHCRECITSLPRRNGMINLNLYSPNASSTSSRVGCNSNKCWQADRCTSSTSDCPFQLQYNSANDTSSGTLVEDVLHLITEEEEPKVVEAPITLGCADVQTGRFRRNSALNGLLGLGQGNLSVPSELANAKIASDSFSMCFGRDGTGRISFGDKGNSDQTETALNPDSGDYNVTITHVNLGGQNASLEFTAVFDSGMAFTSLIDPAYTFLTQSINEMVKDPRSPANSNIPFEFCYGLSPNQSVIQLPLVELEMKGGAQYVVHQPFVLVANSDGTVVGYCLALLKNNDTNIIGQNFMTGYRLVFDRERMVLGWKKSHCYDDSASNSTSAPSPLPSSLPPSESPSVSLSPPRRSTPPAAEIAPSPARFFSPNVDVAPPPNLGVTLRPPAYSLLLSLAPILASL